MKCTLALILLSAVSAFGQGAHISQSPWVSSRQGNPVAGVGIAVCQGLATTAASVTSNLAVFTMASNPVTSGFVQGMTVQVSGFTGADTYFNAGILANGALTSGLPILSVTPTTVTVSLIHANANATTNGSLVQFGNSVTSCAGLVTIYTDAGMATTTTNPFTSDGLGNYDASVPAGIYYVQVYGSGVTTTLRQITVPVMPGSAPTLSGNITFTGNNTHSGTETFSGALNSTNAAMGITDCIDNGRYVAGSSCYATIQAAETAACAISPNGTVYIPATYAGTDTFTYTTTCSAGYPSVDDKRRSASSASAVYSITYPSTDNTGRSLPLGADMSLYTAGSSDHHIKHGLVAATTTVVLGIGANNNVLISSVTCPNCITALPFTGTANLYIGASLVIGRETANEENVSTGNWSIVDATHLNITCAKTHAGTTDVEQQMGSTFFDAGYEFIINPKAPAQSTHGSAARFFDGNGNLVFFYPGNSSDAWPYNGLQIFPSLTGAANSGISSPADLLLRNSSASFCTKMVNSVGNGNIALFCDTLVTITKNISFFGGGNTIFYSDQGVTPKVQITGTTGAVSVTGQITSTLATGTAPLVITSTTPVPNLTVTNHPLVEYCGATSGATQACAKTQQPSPLIVYGDVTLNTATSQSITTLPFTDALYSCSGSDLTTAAGIVTFNTYASTSVTIVETGGVNTDHLRYMCVGH